MTNQQILERINKLYDIAKNSNSTGSFKIAEWELVATEAVAALSQPAASAEVVERPAQWPRNARYSRQGQLIYADTDKGTMRLCDLRGWGHFTGGGAWNLDAKTAAKIQDDIGFALADAWNKSLSALPAQPRTTYSDAAVEICPDCDIAECKHIRARKSQPRTMDESALARGINAMMAHYCAGNRENWLGDDPQLDRDALREAFTAAGYGGVGECDWCDGFKKTVDAMLLQSSKQKNRIQQLEAALHRISMLQMKTYPDDPDFSLRQAQNIAKAALQKDDGGK